MTTDKNNSCHPGATAPGFKIAARLRGEKEDVVFTSCSSCFQHLGDRMVGRAVPASRPPHRRKLRLPNSRYTSFGGISCGAGRPAKIFGKVSAAQEVPPKFQRLLLRCRKSRYFPIINFFNRYLAEPAPIPGVWFLSDICCLLFGLVFGLFVFVRVEHVERVVARVPPRRLLTESPRGRRRGSLRC